MQFGEERNMSKFKLVNRVVDRDGADQVCTMVKEISATRESREAWQLHRTGKLT